MLIVLAKREEEGSGGEPCSCGASGADSSVARLQACVRFCKYLRDDDDDEDDGREDHDRQDHGDEDGEEAVVAEGAGCEAGGGQAQPQGGEQEGLPPGEEEGHRAFRSGELEPGACGHLRRQEDAAHSGFKREYYETSESDDILTIICKLFSSLIQSGLSLLQETCDAGQ